ncbi:MAG: RNA polymerase sigma-70 factor [Bacteroidetes bacterium]|nr:RNA polymerase sigma-70 factor [Bacteroidota bacterium]
MRATEQTTQHLEQLFYKYQSSLHWFCMQYVKNTLDADEIINDTFLAVWNKKEELILDDTIKKYLYTVVKNKSLNHLKKLKVEATELLPEFELATNYLSPIDYLQAKETETVIFELIEKLPLRCKQIFVLSRKENMSNKEICILMEISEKTVENQITIAIKFIKDGLNYQKKSNPNFKLIILPWMLLWLSN